MFEFQLRKSEITPNSLHSSVRGFPACSEIELTFLGHGEQLWSSMWRYWRPPGNMNVLALGSRVVLQQRLAMLPASKGSNSLADLGLRYIDQAVP